MKELDLAKIRAAIPGWPSELDVAKHPGNWAAMAQTFHGAAHILNDEYIQSGEDWYANVGEPVDPQLLRKRQIAPAAIFCLAFSLELAIKAAHVKQGALNDLQSREKLPFATHGLVQLAKSVDCVALSDDEIKCLEQSAAIISAGKYPVGVSPDGSADGVRAVVSFDDFALHADRIYKMLIRVATDSDGSSESES